MDAEHTPALAAQIGYVLDHPGTLGEVAAYMKRLECQRADLLAALERFAKGDYGIESVRIAKAAMKKARGQS